MKYVEFNFNHILITDPAADLPMKAAPITSTKECDSLPAKVSHNPPQESQVHTINATGHPNAGNDNSIKLHDLVSECIESL